MRRYARSYKMSFILLFLVITLLLPSGLSAKKAKAAKRVAPGNSDYNELLNNFKPRNIGPANMGGRTVDFAVVESNSAIIYAAVGPSGLWKSIDNGIHWAPVFDKQGTASIGTVAVSQSHPDIVWVGTGEATSRNSIGIGDGIYKSTDGGHSWKHMGLTDSRHIDRVIIDPRNPDIVYVGVLGHLWGANKERGVYKTIDGGKHWQKILYFDEDTGIADMAMDLSNTHTLYAAAYNHRRKPYHFTSGGPHSGIYKTTDGGETWKQLKNGLPEGVNGRCGVAVSRSKPNVVYALVENKQGGLFRSLDKGETWTRMADKKTYDKVNFRPFYYSKLTIDPNNHLVIYVYSGGCFRSEDGGKTFKKIAKGLHPDHHRVWVDPKNSDHIIDGNDGGIDISWDRGKQWYAVRNQTWAEIYQLSYDMRTPYYVYVGLQDNGCWAGPSNSRDKNGIMNMHWYPVGGGDGFYTQVSRFDHSTVYRNLQMGYIERFEQESGQKIDIMPRSSLDEEPYRFNWNSPILVSYHKPDLLYFGGNFLFKSTDKGNSWQKISPDLSTNDPKKIIESGGPITVDNTGAEVHCSIFTLAESWVDGNVLWAGTDDGNLWVTQDQGKNWTNVIKNIKGLPADSWVSRVEASKFAKGTVYVTFDRHRSDDYKPYVFKSMDYGKTWTSLRNNLPKTGYLYVIREDTKNKNLLYLGSEFGLFFSFDGGKQWLQFKKDFPTTSVRDIAIHPRENDLIVGTHGRGAWIFDDISALQEFNGDIGKKAAHLFSLRNSKIYYIRADSELYSTPIYTAPNPDYGVAVDFYLKEKTAKDKPVQFHIYDPLGKKVRTLESKGKKGLNRIYWDLHGLPPFKKIPEIFKGELGEWFGIPTGPKVYPGVYKILMVHGKAEMAQTVKLVAAKNLDFPLDVWKENYTFVTELNKMLGKSFAVAYGVGMLHKQMQALEKDLIGHKKTPPALMDAYKVVADKLARIKKVFSMPTDGYYRRPLKTALHGGYLPEQVFMIAIEIIKYPGKPTETQKQRFKELSGKMIPLFMEAMTVLNKDLPNLNKVLREHKRDYIKAPEFPKDM
jgi:photosystem II stability/assembly factor-like uncharacterized protein